MNWKTFDSEMRKLCGKVNYKPDCVVGIARGGVVPAVLIAKRLKI